MNQIFELVKYLLHYIEYAYLFFEHFYIFSKTELD